MKKRNFLFLFFLLTVGTSCQNKTFDLSTLKLGESAEPYALNKNALLEIVPNSPDKDLVTYSSGERNGLTYEKIPIDSSHITFITVWKNKIGSIEVFAKEEYSFQLAEKLLSDLGTPTAVFIDETSINPEISRQIFSAFHSIFPDDTKWVENEWAENNLYDKFEHPYMLFWRKNDVYHVFGITVDWSGRMRNQYHPVTKEAYETGRVFGYPYPLPEDSPLFSYMND